MEDWSPVKLGLTRRERRKLEVRGRILEAATELFDAQGIHETKLSEISDRADVAHKTFFNHFPSKQHLLRALSESGLEQLLADIEQVRRTPGTTRDRIRRLFDRIADNAESAGPMHRELLTEMIHAMHDSSDESAHVRRLHDAFDQIVADGVARGDLGRDHSPETLADVVLGAFYSLMFNWAHVEGYALRRRSAAAARFLTDALAPHSEETS
jgi:AcrR family transcriptional regulator